jgi:hypothetical protein
MVGAAEFIDWWKTPKLVRGAVYSPSTDAAAAADFGSAYQLPVTLAPREDRP